MDIARYVLPELMEEFGTPTLKAFAELFRLRPTRLYAVAKTPKDGEDFGARNYNWEAIERFLVRRLDPDSDLHTLEDVLHAALEIDKDIRKRDKRFTGTGFYSSSGNIEVDGKMIPIRRHPSFEMPTGSENPNDKKYPYSTAHPSGPVMMLKKDNAVYRFVYQTKSCTILRSVDVYGQFNTDNLRIISNSKLNMVGLTPDRITYAAMEKAYMAQGYELTQIQAHLLPRIPHKQDISA